MKTSAHDKLQGDQWTTLKATLAFGAFWTKIKET